MSGMLLFSPLTIRGVELRNRIVVPPMHQYSAVKGFPTDWHLMNAGKFAAGGAGLVVVESTKVERRGCGTLGDLGIWDDAFVEPLARLVKFIKQQNSVAGIQLGHSGRKARANRPWEGDGPLQRTPEIDDWDAWTPVAPSAIAHSEKWPVPKALERREVKDLVQAWGQAARRAHQAGFDVLELHGAHGYLVHQFLSERSNQRTDEYGGSEANRMRFITEITEAVRSALARRQAAVRPAVGGRQCRMGPGTERAAGENPQRQGRRRHRLLVRRHHRSRADPGQGDQIQLPGAAVGICPPPRRHHDHGGRPDHSRRPGRADPAATGRPI